MAYKPTVYKTGPTDLYDEGKDYKGNTGSSRLMRISLLRFFKTITKIWLMRFFGLKILLLRT